MAVAALFVTALGVPQRWKNFANAIWNARLRGSDREGFRPETGQTPATFGAREGENRVSVQATSGYTDREIIESMESKEKRYWQFCGFRFSQSSRSRPPRTLGHDEELGRSVRVQGNEVEGDVAVVKMGAVFEGITAERPEMLDDLDVIQAPKDQDREKDKIL